MADLRLASVAVCFHGWHGVTIPSARRETTAASQLVSKLGTRADVLLALSHRADGDCTSIASCRLHERLGALMPFVTRLVLERQPTIAELHAQLSSLPHWQSILRAFNNTRHSWRPFHTLSINNRTFINTRSPRHVSCVGNPRFGHRQQQQQQSPVLCDGLKEQVMTRAHARTRPVIAAWLYLGCM